MSTPRDKERYKPGELLFAEGDQGGGLYVILSGKVLVFRKRGANEVPLAEFGPGNVLGTMTILTGQSRTASAKALEPTEVAIMGPAAFAAGVSSLPKWATAVIKDLTARIKSNNEATVESYLREQKLRSETSNVFHHLAQMSYLAAFFIRLGTFKDGDGLLFPPGEVFSKSELFLNLRSEYLQSIWDVFAESAAIRMQAHNRYDRVWRDPDARILEALADYAYLVAREGFEHEGVTGKLKNEEAEARRALNEKICRALQAANIVASSSARVRP
ncbi:MAG: Crp/Fnr family transcriptional regulator [Gammaproteobacteria bacterium]|nr:Crp/Fnr family transcriptional regulator [Gammaproteobacteria bacterium]